MEYKFGCEFEHLLTDGCFLFNVVLLALGAHEESTVVQDPVQVKGQVAQSARLCGVSMVWEIFCA